MNRVAEIICCLRTTPILEPPRYSNNFTIYSRQGHQAFKRRLQKECFMGFGFNKAAVSNGAAHEYNNYFSAYRKSSATTVIHFYQGTGDLRPDHVQDHGHNQTEIAGFLADLTSLAPLLHRTKNLPSGSGGALFRLSGPNNRISCINGLSKHE